MTRLVEGEQRRPAYLAATKPTGRVLNAGASGLTAHQYWESDPYYDQSRLAQKKSRAKFTPANIYNPQTWQDLISKTLDANDMVKGGAAHKSRRQNECLAKTKRILIPDLQDEVDCKGNKITGCIKKLCTQVWKNNYQIGEPV